MTGGVGTFNATLTTAGTQTLIATDTVTASLTATSGPITVSAAAATHFAVSAPATATQDIGFGFTVKAEDQFNNVATGYAGSVHFTSSDVGASTKLPGNAALVAGVGSFSATLSTLGSQTVVATDTVTSSITGQATINVLAPVTDHFVIGAPVSAAAGTASPSR